MVNYFFKHEDYELLYQRYEKYLSNWLAGVH